MISADRLDRVRLVQKTSGQTAVESKVHKAADAETLTPLITAMGLDLAKGFSGVGGFNLVVEGMSDYYYLNAFRHLVSSDEFRIVSVVPCVGAAQIPQVVGLLIGWGLSFAVLLDGDNAGNRVRKILIDKMHVAPSLILMPGPNGHAIEDVLSQIDFRKYVLIDVDTSGEGENSKIVRTLSKAVLARQFYERALAGNVQISDGTRKSCLDLFERIALALELPKGDS